jgi:hypothetical protein
MSNASLGLGLVDLLATNLFERDRALIERSSFSLLENGRWHGAIEASSIVCKRSVPNRVTPGQLRQEATVVTRIKPATRVEPILALISCASPEPYNVGLLFPGAARCF